MTLSEKLKKAQAPSMMIMAAEELEAENAKLKSELATWKEDYWKAHAGNLSMEEEIEELEGKLAALAQIVPANVMANLGTKGERLWTYQEAVAEYKRNGDEK